MRQRYTKFVKNENGFKFLLRNAVIKRERSTAMTAKLSKTANTF